MEWTGVCEGIDWFQSVLPLTLKTTLGMSSPGSGIFTLDFSFLCFLNTFFCKIKQKFNKVAKS